MAEELILGGLVVDLSLGNVVGLAVPRASFPKPALACSCNIFWPGCAVWDEDLIHGALARAVLYFITSVMALPKSLRLLAIVTIVIFCWMIVQIFRAPGQAAMGDTKTKFDDMIRDPNLDRETMNELKSDEALLMMLQQPANHQNHFDE